MAKTLPKTRQALHELHRHFLRGPIEHAADRLDQAAYHLLMRACARVLPDPCEIFDHRPSRRPAYDGDQPPCALCGRPLVKDYGRESWYVPSDGAA